MQCYGWAAIIAILYPKPDGGIIWGVVVHKAFPPACLHVAERITLWNFANNEEITNFGQTPSSSAYYIVELLGDNTTIIRRNGINTSFRGVIIVIAFRLILMITPLNLRLCGACQNNNAGLRLRAHAY